MIPLRDNIPSRSTPVVNYTMIALCAVTFVAQLATGEGGGAGLTERLGMIPQRVFHPDEPVVVRDLVPVRTPFGIQYREAPRRAAETPFNPWLTLVSCIFLHGGWLHFLGNMWFLYIFGDNVEDRLGHIGYAVFYLGCGVAASATHLFTNPDSALPTVGASGAIAGVMGAYFLLYPRAKVLSLVPIFIIFYFVVLPAPLFLGLWFLLQFFQGTLSVAGSQAGGVAWWAHVGGFVAGFLVAGLLRLTHFTRPPVDGVLPNTDHMSVHRYRRGSW